MKLNLGTGGRVSALIAIAVVLVMIAVPFTAIGMDTEYSEGAPKKSVSYNANGGGWETGVTTSFDYEIGEQAEVRFDNIPKLANNAFLGWAKSNDATTPDYKVTDDYDSRFFKMTENNIILYAVWEECASNAVFSLNDTKVTVTYGTHPTTQENTYFVNETPITGNVIKITGSFANANTGSKGGLTESIIKIESTAPYGSDDQLYIIIDEITIRNDNDYWDSTRSSSTVDNVGNPIQIFSGAALILQTYNDNNIISNSPIAAKIRVPVGAIFTLQGQGDSKLNISGESGGSDHPHAGGAGIGGQGSLYADGNEGEQAGTINIESGTLTINLKSYDAIHSPGIGSGGTRSNGDAPDGGIINIHGGKITITLNSNHVYGAAIGGAGGDTTVSSSSASSGSGGKITITGGTIRISYAGSTQIAGASIGGGGSYWYNAPAGDSGDIQISGGDIAIDQTSHNQNYASGIGSGGSYKSNAGDADGTHNGVINRILISGKDTKIYIKQESTSHKMVGAGIGGGGSDDTVRGGNAYVEISGGDISIQKGMNSDVQGAGIGGGAGTSNGGDATVKITGGNVNVYMYSSSSSDKISGAGIGGGYYTDSGTAGTGNVTIDGGTVTVNKRYYIRADDDPRYNLPSKYVDIGKGGELWTSPSSTIKMGGGSIYTTDSREITNAVWTDTDIPLKRTLVYLLEGDPTSNVIVNSVFVRMPAIIDPSFNTARYVDFNITSAHPSTIKNSARADAAVPTDTFDKDYLYLYLPNPGSGKNNISVEVADSGLVKYYESGWTYYDNTVVQTYVLAVRGTDSSIITGAGTTYYRIVYRLGDKLAYMADYVHYDPSSASFTQTFKGTEEGYSAPNGLSYLDMYDSADSEWDYWTANDVDTIFTYTQSNGKGTFTLLESLKGKLIITLNNGVVITFVDPRFESSGHENNIEETRLTTEGMPVELYAPTSWEIDFDNYALSGWVDKNGTEYVIDAMYNGERPNIFSAVWKQYLTNIYITDQPSNAYVDKTENAVFVTSAVYMKDSVTDFGIALNYEWEYSTNGGSVWNNVVYGVGVNSKMLEVSLADYKHGDMFRCVVTGEDHIAITTGAHLYLKDSTTHYVSTMDDLRAIGVRSGWGLSDTYLQANDIIYDLSMPSSTSIINGNFSGTYNGNGYELIGISINSASAGTDIGLFNRITGGATIENVGMVDANLVGSAYVGGIAATANSPVTVRNCYFIGNISGSSTGAGVGGIIGSVTMGDSGETKISDCYAVGNITSTGNDVGGIIGYTYGGANNVSISNCYNASNVSASKSAGGIVGKNGADIKIEYCYNTGDIYTMSSAAGGIVGIDNGGASKILYCYNTGTIAGNYAGGIVAQKSFWRSSKLL